MEQNEEKSRKLSAREIEAYLQKMKKSHYSGDVMELVKEMCIRDRQRGLITCMRSINEQCVRQLNGEVDESDIQAVMRMERSGLNGDYTRIIENEVRTFMGQIYHYIREHGYNLQTCLLYTSHL